MPKKSRVSHLSAQLPPSGLTREPINWDVIRPEEEFWRDHQKWLQEKGYMLRPRYMPDWVPSWKGTSKEYYDCEDGRTIKRQHLLDATRLSDGELVLLKRISKTIHPLEVEIMLYFCSESMATHPHNHAIPLYEVLELPEDPDKVIMVMPLLRRFNDPQFQTVGEVVEFFRQIFEGLHFMHQCHVAHRDCMDLNIMMDPKPMFPQMFHPMSPHATRDWKRKVKYSTRTARPTKYLFIDFGLSRKYDSIDGPIREDIIFGGDKTVPEFQDPNLEPQDPFPTDVYYIGNMIREEFLQNSHSVDFMQPLVADMVQDDPTKRPTMDEVVERFNEILSSLGWRTLRSRYTPMYEWPSTRIYRSIRHFIRTTIYILTFRKAMPTP